MAGKLFRPCRQPSKTTCLFPSASLCSGNFTPQVPFLIGDLWAIQPLPMTTPLAGKRTHSNKLASATNSNSMPAHEQCGPNLNGSEESRKSWRAARGRGGTEVSRVPSASPQPGRSGPGSHHHSRGGEKRRTPRSRSCSGPREPTSRHGSTSPDTREDHPPPSRSKRKGARGNQRAL